MENKKDVLLQNLRKWGCDVDGALERFLGDWELYEKCLATVTEDKAFKELKGALEAADDKTGFEAAHTLKGVFLNLGLTPMYETIVDIVEPARAGKAAGLISFYEELQEQNHYLKKLLELE